MNQEDAKAWLPILQALAEGKPIEKMNDEGIWIQVDAVYFNCKLPDNYRVKPEPKYRPFRTMEECWEEMLKHEPFGWVMDEKFGAKFFIDTVSFSGVKRASLYYRFHDYFESHITFVDGSPFGMKVE